MLRLMRHLSQAQVSRAAKLAIHRAVYRPTILYGHEIWYRSKQIYSTVEAADMRILRSISKNRRGDKVSNQRVREALKVGPIIDQIERSQLRYLGHVIRMSESRLPLRVYRAECARRPVGKRPRGRPRFNWSQQLVHLCKRLNMSVAEAERAAQDRKGWSARLRAVTTA